MKKIIITIIALVVLAGAGFYFFNKSKTSVDVVVDDTATTTPVGQVATSTTNKDETVLGKSEEGRDIVAYHYGTGTKEIVFVGGIHGGYEWNTVLVARQLQDYLKADSSIVPENIKVTVIPLLNPDGLNKTVGTTGSFSASSVPTGVDATVSGRFNANGVDLNRNFDCDWQEKAVWQNKPVSGGTHAFSEPEALAFKNYIETSKPTAVIVWYSSAGGVYASSCHNGVSSATNALTKTYAQASGYKAYESFNFYEITGDMVNWLAKIKVPAISVLLTNHTDTEWTKNVKGVEAVLKLYSK